MKLRPGSGGHFISEAFATAYSMKNSYSSIVLSLVFLGQACEAKGQAVSNGPYHLDVFRTHTRERLNIVYPDREDYNQDFLGRLN